MTYPPGEGPITEEEAKAQVEADAANDDVEPPPEPLEDKNDNPDVKSDMQHG